MALTMYVGVIESHTRLRRSVFSPIEGCGKQRVHVHVLSRPACICPSSSSHVCPGHTTYLERLMDPLKTSSRLNVTYAATFGSLGQVDNDDVVTSMSKT